LKDIPPALPPAVHSNEISPKGNNVAKRNAF
jgi:hypothetical protein